MCFDFFCADGLEGSQADVQGDFCLLHPVLSQLGEDLRSEMEPRGRSGNGASFAGVHGLIPIVIRSRIRTRNVGWKRDVTDLLDGGEEIGCRRETNATLAELAAGNYLGLKLVLLAEKQTFADCDLAAGTDQAFPIIRVLLQLASKKDLNAAAEEFARGRVARAQRLRLKTLTAPIEARGKHFGVVEDDEISRVQQAGKITKVAILE